MSRFLFLLTVYHRRQLLWLHKNNWKIKFPSSGQHRRENKEIVAAPPPLENSLMHICINWTHSISTNELHEHFSFFLFSLCLSVSLFYGKCHIIVTCQIQIENLFNWLNERHDYLPPLLLIENPFSVCLCNPSAMLISRYTWVRLFSRSSWCVFQLASLLIHWWTYMYGYIYERYCRSFWWTKSNDEVNCKAIKNDTLMFLYTISEGLWILFSFTFVHLLCISENFRALVLFSSSFCFFAFYRSFVRSFFIIL